MKSYKRSKAKIAAISCVGILSAAGIICASIHIGATKLEATKVKIRLDHQSQNQKQFKLANPAIATKQYQQTSILYEFLKNDSAQQNYYLKKFIDHWINHFVSPYQYYNRYQNPAFLDQYIIKETDLALTEIANFKAWLIDDLINKLSLELSPITNTNNQAIKTTLSKEITNQDTFKQIIKKIDDFKTRTINDYKRAIFQNKNNQISTTDQAFLAGISDIKQLVSFVASKGWKNV